MQDVCCYGPRYNSAEETEVQKHKDLPPKTEMPVNVWLPGRPIAGKFFLPEASTLAYLIVFLISTF